ncbi:MAG: peptide chain release factor N(5)-glutamine methyltransferase [Ignavibacteriaceae bacterium]|nr:peptide chain release factor N(5)-glutamine methyltransferase [Ignavibacteriaceae bacterium]
MLTVLEAIKLSDEYLQKYKIESSRLNAELLLADILNCKRLDLYLLYDRPLNNDELNKYREHLKRRTKREPLQYIVGHVEFYGLKFLVNSSVLIPRPETELLVEYVIKQAEISKRIKILDIGVGSGNISIALLKNLPDSFVLGIDINEDALTLSELNAKQNNVDDRLEIKKFDIQKDNPESLGKFDLIISNPPYISIEDFKSLEPELRVYEPAVALTDYSDGYSFYERIISVSKQILNNSGKLFFELGKGHHQKVADMLKLNGFTKINIFKDYSNIERIISGEL